MKQMLEKHGSIEEALDATAKIMEETHIKETICMINSGDLHLGNLKAYIDKLNPKNPEEFVWKVITHCQGPRGPHSRPQGLRAFGCCWRHSAD